MYQKIVNKIIELGEMLPTISGSVVSLQENKQSLSKNDVHIEKELTHVINTFSGDHSIYAEELHKTFIKNDSVWIIDPISNTENFIHGMPHYAIVLSHLYKGEVQFAVMYDPSNKELFTAEKGKGTFLNGKQVHVSNHKENLLVMISSPWELYKDKALQIIEEVSNNEGTIRILGSLGLHYAYVACGRADVAISFNKDTFPEFAGKLLVEEAGGKFTDFNGAVLNVASEGIIASNGVAHDQVTDLIKGIV